MDELLKQTKLDFTKKGAHDVAKRLPRIKDEGEMAKRSGDNKRAFIYLKRWLNIVEWVKKTKAYRDDTQYYDKIFNINLEHEVKALFTEVEKKMIAIYAPEKPEPEIEEASDVQTRTSARAKNSLAEGVLDLPETPTDEPLEKESDDFMSCLQLFQFMKPQYRPLIIDIRSKEDYRESRIKSEQCINIPADQIKAGVLASSFEKLFVHDKKAYSLFDHRSAMYTDIIVILDWSTTSSTLFPGNPIPVLMHILKKWDPGTKTPKITILDGGYTEWLNCYPSFVTNPNVKGPNVQSEAMDEILEYTGVEYPDFLNSDERSSPFNALRIDTSNDLSSSKPNIANSTINDILIDRAEKKSFSLPKETLNRNVRPNYSNITTNDNDPVDTIKNPYKFVNKKISELSKYSRKTDNRDTEDMNVDDDDDDMMFEATPMPNKSSLYKATTKPRVDRSSKPSNLMNNRYPDCTKFLMLQNQLYELAKQQEQFESEIFSIEKKCLIQDANDSSNTSDTDRVNNANFSERLKELNLTVMTLKAKKDQVKEALKKESLLLKNQTLSPNDEHTRYQLDLKLGTVEQRRQNISIERKVLKQKPSRDKEKQKMNTLTPKQAQNGISREPLKSDGSSANTGLKRSYSSPNLAQQDDVKIPLVDRSSKPHMPIPKIPNRHAISVNSKLTSKDREQRMEPIFRQTRPGITGLKNLGNSCYMNSIIQCLSNNIRLAKYFNEDAYVDDLNRSVNNIKQGQVADEVAHVIKALWRGQYKSISPRDLKVVIGQYRLQFDCDDQQDSHEFLVFLLEWLHNDLKKEDDLYLESLSISRRQWFKEIGNGESIISELFIGQLKSSIICATCGNSSFTYETFNSLTLSLPNTNRCTLDDCVKKYVTGQKVSDWKCDNCKAPREATKKFDFIKLPPTVVIHLNRFADSNGWLQKSNTSVDFPLSDFNLASYLVDDVDSKNPQIPYDFHKMSLYAVSVHSGTMNGGHYMSYCRNVGQHKWYQYDDQLVSEVSPSQVKNQGSSAYLLFYTTLENDAYPYIQQGPTMKLGRL